MKLLALCSYPVIGNKREQDWSAWTFVQALKGRHLNGHAVMPFGNGLSQRLDASTQAGIFEFFGIRARTLLRIPSGVTLVPIPASDCTTSNQMISRTTSLAAQLALGRTDISVWNGLRWTQQMERSSEGGTRDPQILFDHLALTGSPEFIPSNVVLVDDVVTRGSHVLAAAALFTRSGKTCTHTIAAARTVWEQVADTFALVQEEFPDFTPR